MSQRPRFARIRPGDWFLVRFGSLRDGRGLESFLRFGIANIYKASQKRLLSPWILRATTLGPRPVRILVDTNILTRLERSKLTSRFESYCSQSPKVAAYGSTSGFSGSISSAGTQRTFPSSSQTLDRVSVAAMGLNGVVHSGLNRCDHGVILCGE